MGIIKNRYEFMILFDVENGNPNGDPDAGNMPRIDAETGLGIVTDVCLKRKIRNYVEIVKEEAEGYKIYIKAGSYLNNTHQNAYDRSGLDSKKATKEDIDTVRQFMCKNYYDVRTFGAVMSTKVSCGIVRGPVQLNFARSIDPIFQQEITITRMAITEEGTKDKNEKEQTNTMGRKYVVPYGLYKAEGYVSASLANKDTGFSDGDLELLWDAIINMFEHDHSALRGKMALRKLIIFKHDSVIGNAPSHKLFDLVEIVKKQENEPARNFNDYEIIINKNNIPDGVEMIEKV